MPALVENHYKLQVVGKTKKTRKINASITDKTTVQLL